MQVRKIPLSILLIAAITAAEPHDSVRETNDTKPITVSFQSVYSKDASSKFEQKNALHNYAELERACGSVIAALPSRNPSREKALVQDFLLNTQPREKDIADLANDFDLLNSFILVEWARAYQNPNTTDSRLRSIAQMILAVAKKKYPGSLPPAEASLAKLVEPIAEKGLSNLSDNDRWSLRKALLEAVPYAGKTGYDVGERAKQALLYFLDMKLTADADVDFRVGFHCSDLPTHILSHHRSQADLWSSLSSDRKKDLEAILKSCPRVTADVLKELADPTRVGDGTLSLLALRFQTKASFAGVFECAGLGDIAKGSVPTRALLEKVAAWVKDGHLDPDEAKRMVKLMRKEPLKKSPHAVTRAEEPTDWRTAHLDRIEGLMNVPTFQFKPVEGENAQASAKENTQKLIAACGKLASDLTDKEALLLHFGNAYVDPDQAGDDGTLRARIEKRTLADYEAAFGNVPGKPKKATDADSAFLLDWIPIRQLVLLHAPHWENPPRKASLATAQLLMATAGKKLPEAIRPLLTTLATEGKGFSGMQPGEITKLRQWIVETYDSNSKQAENQLKARLFQLLEPGYRFGKLNVCANPRVAETLLNEEQSALASTKVSDSHRKLLLEIFAGCEDYSSPTRIDFMERWSGKNEKYLPLFQFLKDSKALTCASLLALNMATLLATSKFSSQDLEGLEAILARILGIEIRGQNGSDKRMAARAALTQFIFEGKGDEDQKRLAQELLNLLGGDADYKKFYSEIPPASSIIELKAQLRRALLATEMLNGFGLKPPSIPKFSTNAGFSGKGHADASALLNQLSQVVANPGDQETETDDYRTMLSLEKAPRLTNEFREALAKHLLEARDAIDAREVARRTAGEVSPDYDEIKSLPKLKESLDRVTTHFEGWMEMLSTADISPEKLSEPLKEVLKASPNGEKLLAQNTLSAEERAEAKAIALEYFKEEMARAKFAYDRIVQNDRTATAAKVALPAVAGAFGLIAAEEFANENTDTETPAAGGVTPSFRKLQHPMAAYYESLAHKDPQKRAMWEAIHARGAPMGTRFDESALSADILDVLSGKTGPGANEMLKPTRDLHSWTLIPAIGDSELHVAKALAHKALVDRFHRPFPTAMKEPFASDPMLGELLRRLPAVTAGDKAGDQIQSRKEVLAAFPNMESAIQVSILAEAIADCSGYSHVELLDVLKALNHVPPTNKLLLGVLVSDCESLIAHGKYLQKRMKITQKQWGTPFNELDWARFALWDIYGTLASSDAKVLSDKHRFGKLYTLAPRQRSVVHSQAVSDLVSLLNGEDFNAAERDEKRGPQLRFLLTLMQLVAEPDSKIDFAEIAKKSSALDEIKEWAKLPPQVAHHLARELSTDKLLDGPMRISLLKLPIWPVVAGSIKTNEGEKPAGAKEGGTASGSAGSGKGTEGEVATRARASDRGPASKPYFSSQSTISDVGAIPVRELIGLARNAPAAYDEVAKKIHNASFLGTIPVVGPWLAGFFKDDRRIALEIKDASFLHVTSNFFDKDNYPNPEGLQGEELEKKISERNLSLVNRLEEKFDRTPPKTVQGFLDLYRELMDRHFQESHAIENRHLKQHPEFAGNRDAVMKFLNGPVSVDDLKHVRDFLRSERLRLEAEVKGDRPTPRLPTNDEILSRERSGSRLAEKEKEALEKFRARLHGRGLMPRLVKFADEEMSTEGQVEQVQREQVAAQRAVRNQALSERLIEDADAGKISKEDVREHLTQRLREIERDLPEWRDRLEGNKGQLKGLPTARERHASAVRSLEGERDAIKEALWKDRCATDVKPPQSTLRVERTIQWEFDPTFGKKYTLPVAFEFEMPNESKWTLSADLGQMMAVEAMTNARGTLDDEQARERRRRLLAHHKRLMAVIGSEDGLKDAILKLPTPKERGEALLYALWLVNDRSFTEMTDNGVKVKTAVNSWGRSVFGLVSNAKDAFFTVDTGDLKTSFAGLQQTIARDPNAPFPGGQEHLLKLYALVSALPPSNPLSSYFTRNLLPPGFQKLADRREMKDLLAQMPATVCLELWALSHNPPKLEQGKLNDYKIIEQVRAAVLKRMKDWPQEESEKTNSDAYSTMVTWLDRAASARTHEEKTKIALEPPDFAATVRGHSTSAQNNRRFVLKSLREEMLDRLRETNVCNPGVSSETFPSDITREPWSPDTQVASLRPVVLTERVVSNVARIMLNHGIEDECEALDVYRSHLNTVLKSMDDALVQGNGGPGKYLLSDSFHRGTGKEPVCRYSSDLENIYSSELPAYHDLKIFEHFLGNCQDSPSGFDDSKVEDKDSDRLYRFTRRVKGLSNGWEIGLPGNARVALAQLPPVARQALEFIIRKNTTRFYGYCELLNEKSAKNYGLGKPAYLTKEQIARLVLNPSPVAIMGTIWENPQLKAAYLNDLQGLNDTFAPYEAEIFQEYLKNDKLRDKDEASKNLAAYAKSHKFDSPYFDLMRSGDQKLLIEGAAKILDQHLRAAFTPLARKVEVGNDTPEDWNKFNRVYYSINEPGDLLYFLEHKLGDVAKQTIVEAPQNLHLALRQGEDLQRVLLGHLDMRKRKAMNYLIWYRNRNREKTFQKSKIPVRDLRYDRVLQNWGTATKGKCEEIPRLEGMLKNSEWDSPEAHALILLLNLSEDLNIPRNERFDCKARNPARYTLQGTLERLRSICEDPNAKPLVGPPRPVDPENEKMRERLEAHLGRTGQFPKAPEALPERWNERDAISKLTPEQQARLKKFVEQAAKSSDPAERMLTPKRVWKEVFGNEYIPDTWKEDYRSRLQRMLDIRKRVVGEFNGSRSKTPEKVFLDRTKGIVRALGHSSAIVEAAMRTDSSDHEMVWDKRFAEVKDSDEREAIQSYATYLGGRIHSLQKEAQSLVDRISAHPNNTPLIPTVDWQKQVRTLTERDLRNLKHLEFLLLEELPKRGLKGTEHAFRKLAESPTPDEIGRALAAWDRAYALFSLNFERQVDLKGKITKELILQAEEAEDDPTRAKERIVLTDPAHLNLFTDLQELAKLSFLDANKKAIAAQGGKDSEEQQRNVERLVDQLSGPEFRMPPAQLQTAYKAYVERYAQAEGSPGAQKVLRETESFLHWMMLTEESLRHDMVEEHMEGKYKAVALPDFQGMTRSSHQENFTPEAKRAASVALRLLNEPPADSAHYFHPDTNPNPEKNPHTLKSERKIRLALEKASLKRAGGCDGENGEIQRVGENVLAAWEKAVAENKDKVQKQATAYRTCMSEFKKQRRQGEETALTRHGAALVNIENDRKAVLAYERMISARVRARVFYRAPKNRPPNITPQTAEEREALNTSDRDREEEGERNDERIQLLERELVSAQEKLKNATKAFDGALIELQNSARSWAGKNEERQAFCSKELFKALNSGPKLKETMDQTVDAYLAKEVDEKGIDAVAYRREALMSQAKKYLDLNERGRALAKAISREHAWTSPAPEDAKGAADWKAKAEKHPLYQEWLKQAEGACAGKGKKLAERFMGWLAVDDKQIRTAQRDDATVLQEIRARWGSDNMEQMDFSRGHSDPAENEKLLRRDLDRVAEIKRRAGRAQVTDERLAVLMEMEDADPWELLQEQAFALWVAKGMPKNAWLPLNLTTAVRLIPTGRPSPDAFVLSFASRAPMEQALRETLALINSEIARHRRLYQDFRKSEDHFIVLNRGPEGPTWETHRTFLLGPNGDDTDGGALALLEQFGELSPSLGDPSARQLSAHLKRQLQNKVLMDHDYLREDFQKDEASQQRQAAILALSMAVIPFSGQVAAIPLIGRALLGVASGVRFHHLISRGWNAGLHYGLGIGDAPPGVAESESEMWVTAATFGGQHALMRGARGVFSRAPAFSDPGAGLASQMTGRRALESFFGMGLSAWASGTVKDLTHGYSLTQSLGRNFKSGVHMAFLGLFPAGYLAVPSFIAYDTLNFTLDWRSDSDEGRGLRKQAEQKGQGYWGSWGNLMRGNALMYGHVALHAGEAQKQLNTQKKVRGVVEDPLLSPAEKEKKLQEIAHEYGKEVADGRASWRKYFTDAVGTFQARRETPEARTEAAEKFGRQLILQTIGDLRYEKAQPFFELPWVLEQLAKDLSRPDKGFTVTAQELKDELEKFVKEKPTLFGGIPDVPWVRRMMPMEDIMKEVESRLKVSKNQQAAAAPPPSPPAAPSAPPPPPRPVVSQSTAKAAAAKVADAAKPNSPERKQLHSMPREPLYKLFGDAGHAMTPREALQAHSLVASEAKGFLSSTDPKDHIQARRLILAGLRSTDAMPPQERKLWAQRYEALWKTLVSKTGRSGSPVASRPLLLDHLLLRDFAPGFVESPAIQSLPILVRSAGGYETPQIPIGTNGAFWQAKFDGNNVVVVIGHQGGPIPNVAAFLGKAGQLKRNITQNATNDVTILTGQGLHPHEVEFLISAAKEKL